MTHTKYVMNMYMSPGTKKQNRSKTATRKKRCPNGSRRDKTSNECAPYKGIQLFKELKDQEISNKPTVSLESLEKGAILKVYKEGELVGQTYVNEKTLQQSKAIEEKGNKLILKAIKRIKKDPTVLQKDKKFLRFQKKMAQKRGQQKGGGETSEESVEIQVQEGVMEQLQSTKIAKLHAKLASLETDLQKEVDLYYSSWSAFNGILAVMNVVGTVAGAIEYGDAGSYFQNFIMSGLFTNLLFFITNIVAYSFSTEDVNTIQTIATYTVFIVDTSILTALTLTGYLSGILILQDSLWFVDFILLSIKNHMISTREKTAHELHLEKEIDDVKWKLMKAMGE